ncbi:hypothetical protein ACHAWF_012835 [Thalassiosira exigua]
MIVSSNASKSYLNGLQLSNKATSALADLADHLRYLGKDELDKEAFHTLLDNMGYKRSYDGLFESLCDDVVRATAALDKKLQLPDSETDGTMKISIRDMARLYGSESYHVLDNGADVGHTLMEYAEGLFHLYDKDMSGYLDISEMEGLIKHLEGDSKDPPTPEEMSEVLAYLDSDGDGVVSLSEFKEKILRANKNSSWELPRAFHYNYLQPAHTTNRAFVDALEDYAKNHRAVTHHFMESIACASFGKRGTAETILLFLSAYAKFNSGFVKNLQSLITMSNGDEREVLRENLSEEMGFYDEETLEECDNFGILRDSVEFVPHHQLFQRFIKKIESHLNCSFMEYVNQEVMEEMHKVQASLDEEGKIGLLASLYFGSELVVPLIYSSLLSGLKLSLNMTNDEASFLLLHISMDSDHADSLRDIVIKHCNTTEDRMAFVRVTENILNARVASYDVIGLISSLQDKKKEKADTLYDKQADKWSRDKPRCLSDFTGRPVVYAFIKDHIKGASVLDVGCGEGYVSRKMTALGAAKVVGLDISQGMIDKAQQHKNKADSEYFLVADAGTGLKKTLLEKSGEANIMMGSGFDVGSFDLGTAVFLFNYMTISEMMATIGDIHSLLKPGGHFVFSVPHPFMATHDTDTFGFEGGDSSKYFALRDRALEGHINTIDGDKLNVRMHFKTIEDYLGTVIEAGFEVIAFKEARVKAGDILKNEHFFKSVAGIPLHLIIKVRKPEQSSASVNMTNVNSLDMLPKKINWCKTLTSNVDKSLVMNLPKAANIELVAAANACYEAGISHDDLDIGRLSEVVKQNRQSHRMKVPGVLTRTKIFATQVRKQLLNTSGAVIIKGLDMDALGGVSELERMTTSSKLAYFILSECIGTVDATARGKLFDVKSANIDSSKADNVLFSVSDNEAGWHTDGASKDRVYDVVALLCISPAASGGKFRVSNACDVFDNLKLTTPSFMMYELTRAIPRDVLENGKGKGTVGVAHSLSRTAALLAMRIKYNSYPIYATDGENRMRFRYMRHWIETGHAKAFWKVPTLLQIAMNMLDDKLDATCCFHQALERGDMIFANNAMLAHARDQFKNDPNLPPRHKVRAWI